MSKKDRRVSIAGNVYTTDVNHNRVFRDSKTSKKKFKKKDKKSNLLNKSNLLKITG